MKPLEEWGFGLSHIKKAVIYWRKSIFLKLMLINFLVVGIVIWLAGVSIKDFACLLVNQYDISANGRSLLFNETMHYYLIRVSVLAIVIATIFYYYLVKRLLLPLHRLTNSIKGISQGQYLEPIAVTSKDEIGQLTDDFNQLVQKFRQVDELRKKMVNDIAHNLRTPLTNIKGYLEALSSGVITGDRELYHSLHEEAIHLTNLVEQLHLLNVWETRKMSTLNTEKMLIEKVVGDSLRSFNLEFENKNIECEIDIQSANVRGNRDGLRQVLDNLIKNAVNYNQGGWIKVKGETEGNMYRVEITNIGQVIPKDRKEKLFERFYRLESQGSGECEGSGLGLAIVKEIIELHEGWVGLSSKENQHTFWFTVPLWSDAKTNVP